MIGSSPFRTTSQANLSPSTLLLGLLGRGAVCGDDNEINAASDVEMTCNTHPFRFTGRNHRIEDVVGYVLVEGALVTKTPQVLFDGFRFEALGGGAVFDFELCEIGLARHRAQRRELVRRKCDGV